MGRGMGRAKGRGRVRVKGPIIRVRVTPLR